MGAKTCFWKFGLCHPHHLGIPHACRARALLFSTQTLQKSSTSYPSIGQKKLNGAASRMMLPFVAYLSDEIFDRFPSETNRLGSFKKILKTPWEWNSPYFLKDFFLKIPSCPMVGDAFSMCPWRCIKEVCAALSSIASAFANEGPGLMPSDVNRFVEQQYLSYREHYNSPFGKKFNVSGI